MKFTSHLRTALPILLVGLTAGALRADIITLKSGEKLNDVKILEETPDSYRVEYHITAKIKDTKTIAKSEVQDIKRATPAEVEFQERNLAKILPTRDLMKAGDYETILEAQLRPFVAKYPGTPEAAQAQKIVETLAEEQNKTRAGQVKVEGKWLDPVAAREDQYNIAAYGTRLEMKRLADEKNNENRYLNALREFEKLRTQYRASLQYVDAIPDALKYLDLFEAQLNYLIQVQPAKAAERAKGLKNLAGPEAAMTKAAIAKEETDFKVIHETQVKNKVKWKDFYVYDLVGLKEELATVQAEKREVAAINRDTLRQENEAYSAVIRYIAKGDVNDAAASLDRIAHDVQNASATNPTASSASNAALIQDLRKQVDLLRAAEQAKKKRDATQQLVQASPNGAPASTENPLEREMRERAARQKAKDEEARKARQAAAAEQARIDAAKTPPPVEDEGFFAKYGLYSGAGLLVALVIGLYVLKNKKKDD